MRIITREEAKETEYIRNILKDFKKHGINKKVLKDIKDGILIKGKAAEHLKREAKRTGKTPEKIAETIINNHFKK